MTSDELFRWFFLAVFFAVLSISGYFRRRARQSGEAISRASEGSAAALLRLLFAAPLYLSFIAYAVNPGWMKWSSLSLPTWLRWIGVAVGIAILPLLYWVMVSIGKNVSETFLTKQSHELVTHGPYRWIRHPLYTTAMIWLLALGSVASNWFLIAMALVAFIAIAVLVVPREEVELTRKFGDKYREYQKRTGRFAPRLFMPK